MVGLVKLSIGRGRWPVHNTLATNESPRVVLMGKWQGQGSDGSARRYLGT